MQAATMQILSFRLDSMESFDVSCSKLCLETLSQKCVMIRHLAFGKKWHLLFQNYCRQQNKICGKVKVRVLQNNLICMRREVVYTCSMFMNDALLPLQVDSVGFWVHAFLQVVTKVHQYL